MKNQILNSTVLFLLSVVLAGCNGKSDFYKGPASNGVINSVDNPDDYKEVICREAKDLDGCLSAKDICRPVFDQAKNYEACILIPDDQDVADVSPIPDSPLSDPVVIVVNPPVAPVETAPTPVVPVAPPVAPPVVVPPVIYVSNPPVVEVPLLPPVIVPVPVAPPVVVVNEPVPPVVVVPEPVAPPVVVVPEPVAPPVVVPMLPPVIIILPEPMIPPVVTVIPEPVTPPVPPVVLPGYIAPQVTPPVVVAPLPAVPPVVIPPVVVVVTPPVPVPEVVPEVKPPVEIDPTKVVCDPFKSDPKYEIHYENGIHASLFDGISLGSSKIKGVADVIQDKYRIDSDIFLSQINVPTRAFDKGFINKDGTAFKNKNGSVLMEWFGLRFDGRIRLTGTQSPGYYEFATNSDDGSLFKLIQDGKKVVYVNNDGIHAPRMICGKKYVYMDQTTELEYEMDYIQGPRVLIAMVLYWRKVANQESELGSLKASCSVDKFKVIPPENFILPVTIAVNPCDKPKM